VVIWAAAWVAWTSRASDEKMDPQRPTPRPYAEV
jgi:hypothetical protein